MFITFATLGILLTILAIIFYFLYRDCEEEEEMVILEEDTPYYENTTQKRDLEINIKEIPSPSGRYVVTTYNTFEKWETVVRLTCEDEILFEYITDSSTTLLGFLVVRNQEYLLVGWMSGKKMFVETETGSTLLINDPNILCWEGQFYPSPDSKVLAIYGVTPDGIGMWAFYDIDSPIEMAPLPVEVSDSSNRPYCISEDQCLGMWEGKDFVIRYYDLVHKDFGVTVDELSAKQVTQITSKDWRDASVWERTWNRTLYFTKMEITTDSDTESGFVPVMVLTGAKLSSLEANRRDMQSFQETREAEQAEWIKESDILKAIKAATNREFLTAFRYPQENDQNPCYISTYFKINEKVSYSLEWGTEVGQIHVMKHLTNGETRTLCRHLRDSNYIQAILQDLKLL